MKFREQLLLVYTLCPDVWDMLMYPENYEQPFCPHNFGFCECEYNHDLDECTEKCDDCWKCALEDDTDEPLE